MFQAIATYHVTLSAECRFAQGEAVYREWRQPDEFGDPGVLVRRQLIELRVSGQRFSSVPVRIQGTMMRITSEQLARQPVWEGQ